MKLSIVMATCDRAARIGATLDSLARVEREAGDAIEVIVVDQSADERTREVTARYRDALPIDYLHAGRRGLSRSRNIGLARVDGEVFCFGDDDCLYPASLLRDLEAAFARRDDSLLSGAVLCPTTGATTSFTTGRVPCALTRWNLFPLVTSVSLFVRNRDGLCDYRFDERLGLGAEFESCEDKDYVYRLLLDGHRGSFEPRVRVFHPAVRRSLPATRRYARGHGAFARKLLARGDPCSVRHAARKVFTHCLRAPYDAFRYRSVGPLVGCGGFWTGFVGQGGVP